MTNFKKITGSILVAVALSVSALALTGCDGGSTPGAAKATKADVKSDFKVVSFGPKKTAVGVEFNKQPTGVSAVWMTVNTELDGNDAAIYFNDVRLKGAVVGKTVTGEVPAELFSAAGVYPMQIRLGKNGDGFKSDIVNFTVE